MSDYKHHKTCIYETKRNKVLVLSISKVFHVVILQGAALMGGINALHTAFPENAEEEYTLQAQMVLTRLSLEDLLQQEMADLEAMKVRRQAEIQEEMSKLNQSTNDGGPTQSGSSDVSRNIEKPGPSSNFLHHLNPPSGVIMIDSQSQSSTVAQQSQSREVNTAESNANHDQSHSSTRLSQIRPLQSQSSANLSNRKENEQSATSRSGVLENPMKSNDLNITMNQSGSNHTHGIDKTSTEEQSIFATVNEIPDTHNKENSYEPSVQNLATTSKSGIDSASNQSMNTSTIDLFEDSVHEEADNFVKPVLSTQKYKENHNQSVKQKIIENSIELQSEFFVYNHVCIDCKQRKVH